VQTVLVVDDDPSVRELISVILELEGFCVFTAESAELALQIARTEHVDVVTIDLGMPGMSGQELSRELRDHPDTAEIRQLIISGEATPNDPGLPVDAVLRKPFEFSLFVEALQGQARNGERLDDEERELDEILARRLVTAVFQPIVDLETGEVVAVEGLTRGPDGPLQTPQALFRAAHRHGRLHELDSLCRLTVLLAALDAAPMTPPLVTVNVEPGTVNLPMSDELRALLSGPLPFRVVVEFTERALTRRTPAVMRHAEEIRQRGNLVALDDVGVSPASVAMLPLAQPEIVKLDMRLVGNDVERSAAEAAVAVAAYAQRTGAIVIAEGIESETHRARAIALGASWGQGHLLGRPGPLETLAGRPIRRDTPPLPRRERVDADLGATPFGIVRAAHLEIRHGTHRTLLAISRQLEAQALLEGRVGAVLVALQDADKLEGRTSDVYATLAERIALVGILGRGIGAEPIPRAYGVDLAPSDPLVREWAIAVIGPHEAVVLCARELPEGSEPRWEYVVSHDPAIVHRIGRLLTRRLVPRTALPRTTAVRVAARPLR
jgi:EAL domain-containing protein (putative c-di-GMP-specific phosphodiesterase class I)